MPPIVIRLLDSINGTRQGLVLIITLFSIYLDELFLELREMGVGCHIGGVLLGAAGYADDIILLDKSWPKGVKDKMSFHVKWSEECPASLTFIMGCIDFSMSHVPI